MKNTEKTAIRILMITALVLVLALVLVPAPATGQVSVSGGDYLMCAYPSQGGGGDALYITDTRSGMLGVFIWDNSTRRLQVMGIKPLSDAFGK